MVRSFVLSGPQWCSMAAERTADSQAEGDVVGIGKHLTGIICQRIMGRVISEREGEPVEVSGTCRVMACQKRNLAGPRDKLLFLNNATWLIIRLSMRE